MTKELHSAVTGKPPITRHPLFPATVALWFGAVFGIGSLAIRSALLESAIIALRIDTILPVTIPLGPTARILIALTLAGAGGLLGSALARRIGRPRPVVRQRKRKAVLASPATEDTADREGFSLTKQPEATAGRAGRRSQLAFRDSPPGSPEYPDRAPVPGTAQILDVSQFGLEGFEPETAPLQPLGDAAEGLAVPQPSDKALSDSAPDPAGLPHLAGEGDHGDTSDRLMDAPARSLFDRQANPALFARPLNASVSEIRWQENPGDDAFGKVGDRRETTAAPEDGDCHAAQGEKAIDVSAAKRIASADLGDLSPVELLERLAISLRRKRQRAATATDSANAAPAPGLTDGGENPHPIVENPAEHPVETLGHHEPEETDEDHLNAPLAPPASAIPAALRPVDLDSDEEDDDDLPGFVPPRHIGESISAAPAAAHRGSGAPSEPPAEELDEGYSSLLDLSRPSPASRPLDQRFVRIEEPEAPAGEIQPVVVFPGQEPEGAGPFSRPAKAAPPQPASAPSTSREPDGEQRQSRAPDDDAAGPFAPPAPHRDPEETERALRSALANIQRMSGAA